MPDELPPDSPDFDFEPDFGDEGSADFDFDSLPSLDEVLGVSLTEFADVAGPIDTQLVPDAAEVVVAILLLIPS